MFSAKNIILGFLMLFFLSSLTRNLFEYRRNLQFYNDTRADFEKEQKKNNALKSELVKNNDPVQLEQTIRNKLNLLKKDEVAVLLPEPTATPVIISPTPIPAYKQWQHLFFQN
jgi:hypothetical protein